jgi:hypothetical protein
MASPWPIRAVRGFTNRYGLWRASSGRRSHSPGAEREAPSAGAAPGRISASCSV